MIYLIGGPPRCGKTTLAKAIAVNKSIPILPLDYVSSVISPYIAEFDGGIKLPLQAARVKTDYSNDIFYKEYSSEQIVDLYLDQAETFWPGIKNCLLYALADNYDFVLEGWQVLPHHLKTLVIPKNQDRIVVTFLIKTNTESIANGLKLNVDSNDWVAKHTREEGTYQAIAKMVARFSQRIEEEADTFGYTVVNMDLNFRRTIDQLAGK